MQATQNLRTLSLADLNNSENPYIKELMDVDFFVIPPEESTFILDYGRETIGLQVDKQKLSKVGDDLKDDESKKAVIASQLSSVLSSTSASNETFNKRAKQIVAVLSQVYSQFLTVIAYKSVFGALETRCATEEINLVSCGALSHNGIFTINTHENTLTFMSDEKELPFSSQDKEDPTLVGCLARFPGEVNIQMEIRQVPGSFYKELLLRQLKKIEANPKYETFRKKNTPIAAEVNLKKRIAAIKDEQTYFLPKLVSIQTDNELLLEIFQRKSLPGIEKYGNKGLKFLTRDEHYETLKQMAQKYGELGTEQNPLSSEQLNHNLQKMASRANAMFEFSKRTRMKLLEDPQPNVTKANVTEAPPSSPVVPKPSSSKLLTAVFAVCTAIVTFLSFFLPIPNRVPEYLFNKTLEYSDNHSDKNSSTKTDSVTISPTKLSSASQTHAKLNKKLVSVRPSIQPSPPSPYSPGDSKSNQASMLSSSSSPTATQSENIVGVASPSVIIPGIVQDPLSTSPRNA